MDVEFKAFHTKCASYHVHLLILVHQVLPVTELICVKDCKGMHDREIYRNYRENMFLFPGSLTFWDGTFSHFFRCEGFCILWAMCHGL